MKRCRKCHVPLEGKFSSLLKKVLKVGPDPKDPSLCSRCTADSKKSADGYTCPICSRAVDEASMLTHVKAEEYILDLIKKDHPEWKADQGTCPECIAYYRELINKAKI